MTERALVLCVDDELDVLEGLALHLSRRYQVRTAAGGAAGLEELRASGAAVAVVLSDMRMPGMDGATFLSRAREIAPTSVRMLLTGQADMESAIAAVNEGQIFRFLTKPCRPERLLAAFEAAVEQHRLITAERILLEQTLRGSIKMLTDVLSLANPQAFGRGSRIKDYARELAQSVGAPSVWQIEVAGMLSQVGCVALPPVTLEKLYLGQALSPEERALTDRLPELAEGLLANIPRLEEVRACLLNQNKHFDGTGKPAKMLRGEAIPLGARILKVVTDFDVLEAAGLTASMALDTMRGRTGWYDPRLLEAFAALRGSAAQEAQVREIPLRLVQPGMTIAEDLRTPFGVLLLPRGFEVTEALLERVRNLPVKGNVRTTTRGMKQERV